MGKCAPLNGGSALEMTKLQPLLADISRTPNAPEHNPGTSLLGLSRHTGVTEPDLAEECGEPQPHGAERHGEPQPCPGAETKVVQPSSTTDPEPPVPCWIAEPEPSEPCLPVLPGPLLPHLQGQAEPLEACPWMELGPSAADSLEARNPASNPQPCWSQGPPATTSLTFSSQSSLCASPPIHSLQSLRSPTGQSGKELAGEGYEEKVLSLWEWALPCRAMLCFFLWPASEELSCPMVSSWPCSWGRRRGSTQKEYNSRVSKLLMAFRPQQSGPSDSGSEAAPQSMSQRHPLLL